MSQPGPDVEGIKARLEKITPGPWERDGRTVYALNGGNTNRFFAGMGGGFTDCANHFRTPEAELEANAAFIAHAPSDMAALLKEREELIKALRIAYGWLPSVEGHLRDGRSFKADQAEVRTILESVLSRTPAAKGGE